MQFINHLKEKNIDIAPYIIIGLVVLFLGVTGPFLCFSLVSIQYMIFFMNLGFVYHTFWILVIPLLPLGIGYILTRFRAIRFHFYRNQGSRWTLITSASILNFIFGFAALLWVMILIQYSVSMFYYAYRVEDQVKGIPPDDLPKYAVPVIDELWQHQVLPASMQPDCFSKVKEVCQLTEKAPEAARHLLSNFALVLQMLGYTLIPCTITGFVLWNATRVPKLLASQFKK